MAREYQTGNQCQCRQCGSSLFLRLFDPPPVVGVLSLVGELTLEKMVKALLPSFKACVFVQISMGVSYNALLIPECVYYICLYRS